MHETLTLNLLDVHKDLKDTLENFMINIDVSLEDGTVIVTAYSNARKVMDHQFELDTTTEPNEYDMISCRCCGYP
jgi:hypothetical protein